MNIKSFIVGLLLLVGFSGCTYYQSVSSDNGKRYIAAQRGLGPMIWENRLYECEGEGIDIRCRVIFRE